MSASASQGETNAMSGDSTQASIVEVRKIWRSDRTVTIPSTDILSFTFSNVDQYDENKPIFVDANDTSNFVSAKSARATVRRLIQGLKEHGLQDGDCVCLHAFNNIWYPLLWLGVIGAGGCISGSNPAYTFSELVHHFNITNTKYVIAQLDCLKPIEEAVTECEIPTSRVFVLAKPGEILPDDYQSWQTLLKYGETDWNFKDEEMIKNGDKPAIYASTSGTTGMPKAAAIPHRYIVAQSTMVEERFKNRAYQPCQLVCLPVFHAFAAQLGLVLPLRLGITSYFLPRFKLPDFVRIVKTFSITDTAVVPPIVAALVQLPFTQRESLRSLRYVICAGAPMMANIQSKLYDSLSPESVISQCWGATELGWVTLFDWKEKDTSGSVGRLMPNVELKIVDDDGKVVSEDGVAGEAYIRSPSMFAGYRNSPEANFSALDEEGFYKTGDRSFVKDDKLFVDGRVKEIMKVNGWQVSPAEIESVLLQHPKITDAAVVGVSLVNSVGLEEMLPCAYVVRDEDATTSTLSKSMYDTLPSRPVLGDASPLTEQDIKDFVASKMVSYKRLAGGVFFVKKIPRNGTGKILRRLLSSAQPQSPVFMSDATFEAGSPAPTQASAAWTVLTGPC